ncbi:FtsX-like permease family protein [Halalkalicoccus jeotgali]|uniref:ABC-type transport system, involved in lipoprotein release, permease component n=1 Tax=Halalkalicoccus jeotgali (strain DSM 18796 / CECT 7217 / JCM 14584 / KCTC 4019 / B3) TaxID=795797 RepID=L9VA19_HALJB|nr:FtsX-like permease family protein [Halalkalicoccus jeotgali]ELY34055.1 ABC-type transport system, involved in lipoprotein release, permease component [Halalkalicoccus jeotgali B3]
MGYQRILLRQWSRRDWLTVVIVAVSTAFLVGTTLLLLTAGTHITTVSSDLATSTTATHHDSLANAEEAAGDDAIVFPVATVEDENGIKHTVIGIPPNAPSELADATTSWQTATIPPPGDPETVSGPVSNEQTIEFEGQQETTTVTAIPQEEKTIFPSWWYTASSSTVETLGPTEAITIESGGTMTGDFTSFFPSGQSDMGVPLISALVLLLAGMHEVLQLLAVATAAGAVIILVVLYSVTRISVRERIETIEIIRSTGGTPLRVLSLFGLRSTLLAFVGVLSGFLVGVVVTHLSIALATWAGVSITLEPQLTPSVLSILVPMLATLVLVGCFAGILAARPAVNAPPTALQSYAGQRSDPPLVQRLTTRLPSSFSPTLLDWRILVPTGATLTVFILLVLLIGGLGAAIAPLQSTQSGTLTSADASHPIDSRLDVEVADAFHAEGIDASPEIVLAQVHDGQPYLARGANYSDFAAVTDSELVKGHAPTAPNEAVVGQDLAESQDLTIGDTRTLGGSDRPGVARVTIVGVYQTNSLSDSQLIVPLETGHHLSVDSGTVHVVRTAGNVDAVFDTPDSSQIPPEERIVQGINTPETAVQGESVPITVHVHNDESSTVSQTLTINAGQQTIERDVTLDPDEEERIEINHTFESTGSQTVSSQGHERTITVSAPDSLMLPETLPANASPGETLLVPVTTSTEEPVSDATVSIDGTEATTNANGIARVELPENEGEYNLTATAAGQDEVDHQIQVIEGQQRLLGATVTVDPRTGTPNTTPETTVTLMNHWSVDRTQDISVSSPTGEQGRTVTLASGESRTIERTLGESDQQIPPGEYEIEVTADEETIATEPYEVLDGEFALEQIPDGAQYQSGAALGQVIENTVGNIQILFATMIVLAGLMTIGSTTAAFTQAVHARRKAIAVYRSTGARRMRVLRIIVTDACKLAIPAVVLAAMGALIALVILNALGLLSVFGVQLMTDVPPGIILLSLAGAIVIAVCSAALAVLPILRLSPTAMWSGTSTNNPHAGASDTGQPNESR